MKNINLFKEKNCTRKEICWQLDFAKGLKLTEWDMLEVCSKCLYFIDNKKEEK